MNQRHHELADHVVNAFRANLDGADQERLGTAKFQELHGLICEALSEELELVAGRVQSLLHELRTEIDKPELEL